MNLSTFENLYKDCSNYCLQRLNRYTSDPTEAEDCFAEAIAKFWLLKQQGKVEDVKNIPAYVFTMSKNLISYNRKKKKKVDPIEGNNVLKLLSVDPEELVDRRAGLNIHIRKALNQIGENCKKLLLMKYAHGYSYDEMRESLGRDSGDSLKTQAYRCMKKLREILKQ